MKVRALDADEDYRFGAGSGDFLTDSPDAVAQCVKTRLRLFLGEWFLDTAEGTPWHEGVLGRGHEHTYGQALRVRILGTRGVQSIVSFADSFDREARALTVTMEVSTIYGAVSLTQTVDVGVQ